MSVTFERMNARLPVDVQEELSRIQTLENPTLQFAALSHDYPHDGCKFPLVLDGRDVMGLIDFAADPKSSPSLLVRVQAFELAADSLFAEKQQQPDEMASQLKYELHRFLPGELKKDIDHMKIPNPEGGRKAYSSAGRDRSIGRYALVTSALCEYDGIDKEFIFPDWNQYSAPDFATVMPDLIPSMALAFFVSLKSKLEAYDGSDLLPLSPFVKLLPLAMEIQKATEQDPRLRLVDVAKPDEITKDAEEISAFLDLKDERTDQFVDQLLELKQAASLIKEFFPKQYSTQAEQGAQKLFAECLYAVRHHLEHGNKTDIKLNLQGDASTVLDLSLRGYEPLELLSYVSSSIRHLHAVVSDPEVGATQVNQAGNFKLYRLWQPVATRSSVSVYVRPRGEMSFDEQLEYGRESEGVEASINYIVDLTTRDGEQIEAGRHQGESSDDRISIRLDREGVDFTDAADKRDPTREKGIVSLDVGSIIGEDNWLSTKVGRLLAWGNILRSNAIGEKPNLNHSRFYFGADDGMAETFEAAALNVISEFESRIIDRQEIYARSSGRSAIRSLQ